MVVSAESDRPARTFTRHHPGPRRAPTGGRGQAPAEIVTHPSCYARTRTKNPPGELIMTMTSADGAPILRPEQIADLLILPVSTESVAGQLSTVVHTSSPSYRVPRVTTDPSAAWVSEGDEIPTSLLAMDEIVVTPAKVAGLVPISSELATDTDPAAAEEVGRGLVREIVRQVDAAFFGDLAAPAPKGLAALTGVSTVTAGTNWTNTDPFAEAIAAAESVGAAVSAFAANPADSLTLAKIKRQTGSNEALLGADPTAPTKRTILGVPLVVSSYVPVGTIWAVPRDRAVMVIRADATVEASEHIFFSSHRIGIRAIMRIGFAFPHTPALVKITKG